MTANEAEMAARTKRLPELFAGRVRDTDFDGLRSMADGGEWGELIDLLIAALRYRASTITADERAELCDLLSFWGLPADPLDDLVVTR